MKFSFKIQQYQTDAVDAVARVFQGQPYNAGVSYLRDMGSLSAQPQQLSLVSNGDDATQVELQDLINDSGFKNEALQLTEQETEVIEWDGYYEFSSNGRHRILAARALGHDIPVKVIGKRSWHKAGK